MPNKSQPVENDIEAIREAALTEIGKARDPDAIRLISIQYLGRKGLVTRFLRSISELPETRRPEAGKRANAVKRELEHRLEQAQQELEAAAEADVGIDVSLPGRSFPRGRLHPITLTLRRICQIFTSMGFDIAEGPEVETDYYNFEALNFPKNHPSRDMQDTFFVSEDIVLRTHTSPCQVRVMEKQPPPVRVIVPGKVFRCDSDQTHTPMFHQVEGLLVDQHITFGDLKGVLTAFVHQIFDPNTKLRFRPSFFPFTEPSAEIDISCVMCSGSGCRVCSHTGWLEILGSGMVHPAVFEFSGYDPDKVTGFAFGMGVERIAMLTYGIDDLRIFFENDHRFLRRF
jgi:phenylalanyl-tRNA synthetase alpha chain